MKKHMVLRFVVFLILCGVAGGLVGMFLGAFGEDIRDAVRLAADAAHAHIPLLTCLLGTVFFAGFLLPYRRAQKLLGRAPEEESQRTEGLLTIALGACASGTILTLLLFIWGSEKSLAVVVLPFGFILLFLTCQVHVVKAVKRLYPNRKGHPLDLRFDRDWTDSFDEAERFISYAAAYRSYNVMKRVYVAAIAIVMFARVFFGIGMLAPLLICLLWGAHTLTYLVASYRLTYQKLPQ